MLGILYPGLGIYPSARFRTESNVIISDRYAPETPALRLMAEVIIIEDGRNTTDHVGSGVELFIFSTSIDRSLSWS